METLLRLQLNSFCLVAVAILWLSGDRRRSADGVSDSHLFRWLLASTAVMILLDSAGWLLDGSPGPAGRAAILTANTLYYLVHTVPTVLFILYADFQVNRDPARTTRLARWLGMVAALPGVLALASPFTGAFFTVDAGNRYVRGPLFPVFAAIQYGLVAFSIGLVIANVRKLRRRVFITLLAYPLPMLLASVLQMFVYGLVLIWPALALFLVASAFNIENRRARTDYLTGTANRRSLDEELARRMADSRGLPMLCGLLIDIDDFKEINDGWGHEAGDRALEDAAAILLSSVRVDDFVARMGGDEFVLLLEGGDRASLDHFVRRIETALARHNETGGRPYRLSLSIGRTIWDRTAEGKPEEFLAVLDADMYERKRQKKGG